MPIITLRDLYVAELRDLYDAEQQILQELPTMATTAASNDLRKALEDHIDETRVQLERLDLLCRQLDITPEGHPCEGIRGVIAEARHRLADGDSSEVLDAAIIGAAQRIEHYETAAYGCARTYAQTLGDDEAARLLQQTLDEEGRADHRLSRLAQRGINQSAGEGVADDPARKRARLRYMAISELRDFKYREFRVRNDQGEDLGSLDGFVVDNRSGRPLYFVVDAGGWFMGRRYLVPIGALEPDEQGQSLRTTLDRDTISRYPPFDPELFLAVNEQEPPEYDERPEHQPPTWLMTGVWMTDASGFAAVPPRATSDLLDTREQHRARDETAERSPERERMIARGEDESPERSRER